MMELINSRLPFLSLTAEWLSARDLASRQSDGVICGIILNLVAFLYILGFNIMFRDSFARKPLLHACMRFTLTFNADIS